MPQPVVSGEVLREKGMAPPEPAGGRWAHAFSLFKSYWFSSDWKFAWFALAVLLACQFGGAYIFVVSNRWEQNFYDSVQNRDAARFYWMIAVFIGIMGMQVGYTLINSYFEMTLGIRWRTELTRRYLGRWMARDRFAEIERLRLIDNPDQRIAEDINGLTSQGLGLLGIVLAFVGVIATSVSMILILLETAEPIRFSLFGSAISIPGSTVWYAFIYAILGSVIMAKIGKPYIRATMAQQHREGDFRATLIHVRRNAGQIGLSGAVDRERASLADAFEQVRLNYRRVIFATLGINMGQGIYERIGGVLPLFLMIPRYFSGAISFGQVMGAKDAFMGLTMQLSYFVQGYARIAAQIANLNRLKGLDDALDHERPRGIAFGARDLGGRTVLQTHAMTVYRPTGEPLLDLGDWTVKAGERWVVRGPSGAGKSTLLRAIVGLWPEGSGSVTLDNRGSVMVVPQRLYLPLGTLKAAVCFPDDDHLHDDAKIQASLDKVGLGTHRSQIHQSRFWQEELSPGEQQRLALTRILLHRPDVLILDEATSALDPENAAIFYRELASALPHATLISVVHDDRLEVHHTHALLIENGTVTLNTIGD
ncbi:MAG: ABC transporter permease [Sphingobium sp.]|nr:MAG: ABC transporter permease [Sphingobium sp.]